MNRCVNCGEVPALCLCTWDEQYEAHDIVRRRDRERRRQNGNPTVIQEEQDGMAKKLSRERTATVAVQAESK